MGCVIIFSAHEMKGFVEAEEDKHILNLKISNDNTEGNVSDMLFVRTHLET